MSNFNIPTEHTDMQQRRLILALAAGTLLGVTADAPAQTAPANWPQRPIHIAFAGAPGGPAEALTRIIGEEITRQLGQPIVVEPKPGGGTTIAARFVAAAPPDGYTLLLTSIGVVGPTPYLYKNLPYDVVKDFAPIARTTTSPNAVVIGNAVPAKNMAEFVAWTRANPGKVNSGAVGLGTTSHLTGVATFNAAGIKPTNITFKGGPEMLMALMRNDVQVASMDLGGFLPQIQQGTMRAIAVTGPNRVPQLPDVPTLRELGMPQADLHIWWGLVAPAGTPLEIRRKLADVVGAAMNDPKVQARYAATGNVPAFLPLDQFQEFIRAEHARFKPIVEASGYRGEN
jgi:tripartite-type tricarboxylate transporter receptor subunit TctC